MGPDTLLGKALAAPSGVFDGAEGGFNNPAIRAAEIPAVNGVTNARVAGPVLRRAHRHRGGRPRRAAPRRRPGGQGHRAPDQRSRQVPLSSRPPSASASSSPRRSRRTAARESFGHTGMGGRSGFADPEHGIGFGYVMNKMGMSLNGDPRSGGLDQGASTTPSASSPPTSERRWPSRRARRAGRRARPRGRGRHPSRGAPAGATPCATAAVLRRRPDQPPTSWSCTGERRLEGRPTPAGGTCASAACSPSARRGTPPPRRELARGGRRSTRASSCSVRDLLGGPRRPAERAIYLVDQRRALHLPRRRGGGARPGAARLTLAVAVAPTTSARLRRPRASSTAPPPPSDERRGGPVSAQPAAGDPGQGGYSGSASPSGSSS